MKVNFDQAIPCPYCGDAHPAQDGEYGPPRTGDLAICSECAGVAVYCIRGSSIELTKATDEFVLQEFDQAQIKQIYLIRQQILTKNDPRSTCN